MKFQNSKTAILNTSGDTPFLTFPALSEIPFVKHGFSTKLGGVSKGCFESMNLSYSSGDDKEAVDENYIKICKSIGLQVKDLVATHQVHKTNVKLIQAADKGKGLTKERDYEEIDGFITNTVNVPLVTYYADCVPLFLVDPINQAIGLSHSGWRGTVNGMGKVTLEAMNQHFGTRPEDVITLIGPSICKDCYEVSEDVANAFLEKFNEKQIKDILFENQNGRYQLDLLAANRHIFLDAGVLLTNINTSNVCTSCHSDLLFSHRATNGKRGALAAFLMLKD